MNSTTVSLDQLLAAAQLLEQNAIAAVVAPASYCKLGEDYQERFVASKMRTALCLESSGSTASSRRSSPTSMISSSAHSSTPNSPAALLVPAGSGTRATSTTGMGPTSVNNNRSSPSSTRQSRAAHNELEKNRRANLRSYLDNLKMVLPSETDTSRDTTLSLLTRARNRLRTVKEQREHLLERRNQMLAEHIRLLEQLETLKQCENDVVEKCDTPVVIDETNRSTPPAYLEYSPSGKPALCDTPVPSFSFASCGGSAITVDLIADGLVPDFPLLYPYPYLSEMRQLHSATTNAC
jgi:ElaB/YqjD/DUF883 family membrane-anchored ribosome-binding protein